MKFAINDQQRDFTASIDVALSAADARAPPEPGPRATPPWPQGVGGTGRPGVTALAVPEEFGGLGAHPVDLAIALERLGRWCVPAGHRIHRCGTDSAGFHRIPRSGARAWPRVS